MRKGISSRNGKIGFVTLLGALVLGTAPAFAELLVYEPFDYERRQWMSGDEPGVGIEGLDGGFGFAGPYVQDPVAGTRNAGIADANDFPEGARTEPLRYVDQAGNRLVTAGNQLRSAFGNRSWDIRPLAQPLGEPGATIWMSFLAQAHGRSGSSRWAFVQLSYNGTESIYVGDVTPVSSGNWSFQLPDRVGGSFSADLGLPMDEPTMFLVKFQYPESTGGFTTIQVWLNPPDLTDEGALPEPISETIYPYVAYTHLGLAGRYSTDFDEIRIGTTYESVTPNEPDVDPIVPQLAIAIDGENVRLTWEAAADGYLLHESADLVQWDPVADTPVVVDEMNEVILPRNQDRQFFRLQQP